MEKKIKKFEYSFFVSIEQKKQNHYTCDIFKIIENLTKKYFEF